MKKRKAGSGQLVCQHLENISREALKKHPDIIKNYVRGRHGVYALYRGKSLYYVGLASKLHLRLKQHLRDHHAKSWDRFSVYLTLGDKNLKEMEVLLLRITKPSGNKMLGNFSRSENLRRSFRHDISERQKAELDDLTGKQTKQGKKPTETIKGPKPSLPDYVKKPLKIRFEYKGKTYRARIRKDGTILYKGKIFKSPSQAVKKITGRGGSAWAWYRWRYERAPGDWVPLNELRK